MDAAYKKKLMDKYGIDEDAAEIINELKRKIRKASPLTQEQKEACEVCSTSNKRENIYNHHMVKVEYLAILVYYYGLYKKERNKTYSPTHETDEHKDETSSKEYIYVLKKDIDLYIPRIGTCERHHNMIHELARDFEGSANKDLLRKAKPKELAYLYECFLDQDKEIYAQIFGENENLSGREYYISYLKIWNDTINVSMTALLDRIERKLASQEDIGDKNTQMLIQLAANVEIFRNEAQSALVALDDTFKRIGIDTSLEVEEMAEEVEIEADEEEQVDTLEISSENINEESQSIVINTNMASDNDEDELIS